MNTQICSRLTAVSLCLIGTAANAEWRCDCTTIVDSCSATVTVGDAWVDVTSDHAQCARVDYFIDGQPLVALVVGGEARQDWLTRSSDPDILIQSCQVCVDRSGDAPPPPARAESTELVPVIQVEPQYPETAAARGVSGFSEVSFTVNPYGQVENPSVTTSEPAGVFDRAALDAISRWRYTANESREPVALTHRFAFELGSALMSLRPAADPVTARQSTTERNQCVREHVSYNYGEMIEVGLINACNDPIVVFSCAEGTGRFSGQWVCGSSADSAQALVRPGDRRLGQAGVVDLPSGSENFVFAAEMFIARAPNSQYWWLACGVDDATCRSNGEQWLRSMNRQLATINPQDRVGRPLSRAN